MASESAVTDLNDRCQNLACYIPAQDQDVGLVEVGRVQELLETAGGTMNVRDEVNPGPRHGRASIFELINVNFPNPR